MQNMNLGKFVIFRAIIAKKKQKKKKKTQIANFGIKLVFFHTE